MKLFIPKTREHCGLHKFIQKINMIQKLTKTILCKHYKTAAFNFDLKNGKK